MRCVGLTILAMLVLTTGSAEAWTTDISVGSQTVEWQSQQRFAKSDFLRLRLFTARHELLTTSGSGCRSRYYGYGLAVFADACGPRLKIRAANAGTRKNLRVHYYRT